MMKDANRKAMFAKMRKGGRKKFEKGDWVITKDQFSTGGVDDVGRIVGIIEPKDNPQRVKLYEVKFGLGQNAPIDVYRRKQLR